MATELIAQTHLTGQFFTGEWREAGNVSEVVEPATGTVLGKIALASAADIEASCAGALRSQPAWEALGADDRAAVLQRIQQIGEDHASEIIEWIMRESGSTRMKAEFEFAKSLKAIRIASGMPHQAQGLILPSERGRTNLARRRPLGVVGVIAPFNFPLYLAIRAVAPALAVGNAVVLKPDPRTAICGGFVIARLFELAGLPAGLLHVLPGDGAAGGALCADPNVAMIQFTGSTQAGRKVGRVAGENLKKVSLELGGKNSLIILDDADMELALSNAAFAAYLHQGQICMSAGRILVHGSIATEFSDKLAEKARTLRAGDPMSQQFAMGPLIDRSQFDHARLVLEKSVHEGAELLAGGPGEDCMFAPAVLRSVTPAMPAFQEEIFGPVAVIVPFESDAQAIELANATDYGLSAAIISRNVGRAMAIADKLKTGIIHINDQTVNDEVVNPFGGTGASGNGTSIGGPANWELFTHWQWTTIKGTAPLYPY